MHINLHTLLHLPVYTQSGARLGKVRDVKLNIESHSVQQYVVRAGLLNKNEYLIGPAQVISISEEKMIVDDTITKDMTSDKAIIPETKPKAALGGVMPRIEEK